jgi:hypothetical protein
MSDLDTLLQTARTAQVSQTSADAYVRELERWARPRRPVRSWLAWATAGVAAAAALAVYVLQAPVPQPRAVPIGIGDRVAIVAAPAAKYHVALATAQETRIIVERGTVTARLWHEGPPHRLALEGGGTVATAMGTVYSLTLGPRGAVVHVDRGTVEVRDADGVHAVTASNTWPPGQAAPDPRAAAALLAIIATVSTSPATMTDAGVDHTMPDAAITAPPPAHASPAIADALKSPSVKDRWHRERMLRGQGKLDEAVAECLDIAKMHDATWAPIALVEAARIYLGPLSDPEHALAIAERAIAEWPADGLVTEARDLRCRALRELGRGSACTSSANR